MKAAIYARVSKDELKTSKSCDQQLEDCRDRIASLKWEVVAEFRDDGITGNDDERPAFNAMLEAAAEGQFDVLMIWDTDRLSRAPGGVPRTIAQLMYWGVRVMDFGGYDTESDDTGMMAAVKGGLAAAERKKISARTKRGRRKLFEQGLSIGGRTYGYRRVVLAPGDPGYNPERKHARREVKEDEAAIVREIFAWRGEGRSCREIASRLNERGVLPPGASWNGSTRRPTKWKASGVRVILRNPTYKGWPTMNRMDRTPPPGSKKKSNRRIHKDHWRPRHDPSLQIVDPTLWDRVDAMFSTNEKMSKIARMGRGPKFALSGIIACTCGARYVISGKHDYRCASYSNGGAAACPNGARFYREDIEEQVFGVFDRLVLTKDHVVEARKIAERIVREELARRASAPKRVPAAVAEIDRELAELREMLRAGKVRAEMLKPALDAAEARRAELLASLDSRGDANVRKLAVAIPEAAERLAGLLRGMRKGRDPRPVRDALRRYLPDGRIVLAPSHDGTRLEGEMVIDRRAYLLEIAAANKIGAPNRS
ncbi:MAG: recombinase family protein [Proteobacteria bacterium]|nr:recombinase family protein [Pseudomonadota bacterium]